jgi:hypothetical protein
MKFGRWNIEEDTFLFIRKILPEGDTILELGSGETTGELAKFYKMYSIEQNSRFLNRYNSTYIYAPIKPHKPVEGYGEKNTWYNARIIEKELKRINYDLLLIDGPSGPRVGLLKYWNLFKQNVPVVFDDMSRLWEPKIAIDIANKMKKSITIYPTRTGKKPFGVIMP